LMEDGRVVTTDAVPLLPGCARGAVAELRARRLDYVTAKSLAVDLSALLAPPQRCSDKRVLLKIADALSRVSVTTPAERKHLRGSSEQMSIAAVALVCESDVLGRTHRAGSVLLFWRPLAEGPSRC